MQYEPFNFLKFLAELNEQGYYTHIQPRTEDGIFKFIHPETQPQIKASMEQGIEQIALKHNLKGVEITYIEIEGCY